MKKVLFVLIVLNVTNLFAQEKELSLLLSSNIEYAPFGFSFFKGNEKEGWFFSQKISEDFLTRDVKGTKDYPYSGYVYDMNELITTGGYYRFISTNAALYIGGGFLHGPYYIPNSPNPEFPVKEWLRHGYSPLIPTLTLGGYFKAGDLRITAGFDIFFIGDYNYNIIPLNENSPVRISSFTIGIGSKI